MDFTKLLSTNGNQAGTTGFPSHAVVRLTKQTDVCPLLRLLLENGYTDVSFVSNFSQDKCSGSRAKSAEKESQTDATIPATSILTANMAQLPQLTLAAPHLAVIQQSARSSLRPLIPISAVVATTCDAVVRKLSGTTDALVAGENSETMAPEPVVAPESTKVSTPRAVDAIRQRSIKTPISTEVTYTQCQICKNPIMANRYSNLINHVKRHASIKRFQCPFCIYQHNEITKVRSHIIHNHGERSGSPIDQRTPDLLTSWDDLMRQCFPEFQNPRAGENAIKEEVADTGFPDSNGYTLAGTTVGKERPTSVGTDDGIANKFITCLECGEVVSMKAKAGHVRFAHLNTLPYSCSLCGYEQIIAKIIEHLEIQHTNDATGTEAVLKEINQIQDSLMDQCFPPGQESCAVVPTANGIPSVSVVANAAIATVPEQVGFSAALPVGDDDICNQVDTAKANSSCSALDPDSFGDLHKELINQGIDITLSSQYVPTVQDAALGLETQPGVKQESKQRRLSRRNRFADTFECLLCHRRIVREPRQSLLNHAKRHCYRKQFRCPGCPYASSESAHVRNHISSKHGVTDMFPLDVRNSSLETSWNIMLNRCFPLVRQKMRKQKQIEEFALAAAAK